MNTPRDFLTSALVTYRRGDTMHSADEIGLLRGGGVSRDERSCDDIRRAHPFVMEHLRERARLP